MRRVVLLVLLLGLLPALAHAAGAEGVWRYDTAKMSAEVDKLAAGMVAEIGPAKLQAMASQAPMMEQRAAALRAGAPGNARAEAQAAGLERMAKMIEAAQGDPKAFFRERLQRLDSPDARLTLRAGGACETLLPGAAARLADGQAQLPLEPEGRDRDDHLELDRTPSSAAG